MAVVHPYPGDIVLLHQFENGLQPVIGPVLAGAYLEWNTGIHGQCMAGGQMYTPTLNAGNDLSGSDYTLECWGLIRAMWAARQFMFGVTKAVQAVMEYGLGIMSDGLAAWPVISRAAAGGSWRDMDFPAIQLPEGAPFHLAVTRDAGYMRLFVNGQMLLEQAGQASEPAGPRGIDILVESSFFPAEQLSLDEVCITKRCLYSAPFTPIFQPYTTVLLPAPEVPVHVWPAGVPQ